MKRLAALASVALLGTDRASLPALTTAAENAPSPLDGILAAVAQQPRERALLNAAGIIAIYAEVGTAASLQSPTPSPPASAAGTDRHTCPPAAAYHFGVMLEGRNAHLLDELLTALAAGGYTAPSTLVPELLERGAKRSQQRAAIITVLSATHRQLAAENPPWRYAAPEADSYTGLRSLWRAADDQAARQGLLRQARATAPQWARQLLELSWKSLPDSARIGLIGLLADGLSLADEPFLEAALDDRNHAVRRKAAELLTQLPAARLAQRMEQRIDAVVRYVPESEQPVLVEFPAELGLAWQRDGVLPRSGKNTAHLRGLQLIEMVSAVPLDHWPARWQIPPDAVVRAMRDSLWPRTLTQALCVACVRQNNERWALALLDATGVHEHALRAAPALSLAACDVLLTTGAARFPPDEPLDKRSRLVQFLRQRQGPWSPFMVRRFWQQLDYHARARDASSDFVVDSLIKQMAGSCPPLLLDEGIARLEELPEGIHAWRSIREADTSMRFRRDMLRELIDLRFG